MIGFPLWGVFSFGWGKKKNEEQKRPFTPLFFNCYSNSIYYCCFYTSLFWNNCSQCV